MTLLTCLHLVRPLWSKAVGSYKNTRQIWVQSDARVRPCNTTHKCKLVHTHAHTLINVTNYYGRIRADTHPCACFENSGIHINSHMSWYVPQHSTAFSTHHLPYLQFHNSPHVSLYFQTTKRLRRSSLDLSALPFFNWNTAASLFASLSVSQPGSQSIHKLPTPATDAHSQKLGKKRNTQGGISNGEKQKQRNRGEQSVILGSVCVAEWLVWS